MPAVGLCQPSVAVADRAPLLQIVQQVSLVINFDLPRDHANYIHRISSAGENALRSTSTRKPWVATGAPTSSSSGGSSTVTMLVGPNINNHSQQLTTAATPGSADVSLFFAGARALRAHVLVIVP
eukprot:SAG25_NODE_155_length_13526_cov_48.309675_1_plen_125_part_00